MDSGLAGKSALPICQRPGMTPKARCNFRSINSSLRRERFFAVADADRNTGINIRGTQKVVDVHRLLAKTAGWPVGDRGNAHFVEDEYVTPHAGKDRLCQLEIATDDVAMSRAQAVEQNTVVATGIGTAVEKKLDVAGQIGCGEQLAQLAPQRQRVGLRRQPAVEINRAQFRRPRHMIGIAAANGADHRLRNDDAVLAFVDEGRSYLRAHSCRAGTSIAARTIAFGCLWSTSASGMNGVEN